MLPDIIFSLTEVRVLIVDTENQVNQKTFNSEHVEIVTNPVETHFVALFEKIYLRTISEPIKESVIDSINPLFGELSQCLLQINKDSRFPKLQSLLSELDRLYLEAKPLLDGLHYMRNEFDRSVKLPFPINEIVRFYINRYQKLSNGRLVFTMESNLSDFDYIVGPYLSIANLLEQLFCYCLAHTEYGFIGIRIEMNSDNTLLVQFCDTGDEHIHSQSYRKGLENSYELVASYLVRQLGGSLKTVASELSGFDIELKIPSKLIRAQQLSGFSKKEEAPMVTMSVTQQVDFSESELQVNYRLLLKELYDTLQTPYDPSLAISWRQLLHKVWPSVAMMGEKQLTEKLKTMHGLLKKEPSASVIQTYRERIVQDLTAYFYQS
jgi:hypothetical protein